MAKFVEFKKATLKDMMDYIKENAPKDKSWFKSVSFDTRKTKVSVPVLDGEGKPIMYQEKDKAGNPKFKDGKPVMRQKVKMVESADGEEKEVFNCDDTIKLDNSSFNENNKGGCCKGKKKKNKNDIRNKSRHSYLSMSTSDDKDPSVF